MPRRGAVLALTFGATVSIGAAPSASGAPAAASGVKSGYANLLTAGAPTRMPMALPPGPTNSFLRDTDLPEVGHYLEEVIRFTQGGLRTTVAQLAVVRPGEAVQVMVMQVSGQGRWKVTSRSFGVLPWARYLDVRQRFLKLLQTTTANSAREPGALIVCTDSGPGTLDYHSRVETVQIEGCGNDDAVAFGEELTRLSKQAVS